MTYFEKYLCVAACAVEKFLDTVVKSSMEAARIRDARTLTSAHLYVLLCVSYCGGIK